MHCLNTLCSILVTLLGTCTLTREVHHQIHSFQLCSPVQELQFSSTMYIGKTPISWSSWLSLVFIPSRDWQSMKRHSSMVSILGRSTFTNFFHPWKAPNSIPITPGGILISTRPLDKNTYFFICLSASGRIFFSLKQFVKASLPIVSTDGGRVIFSNWVHCKNSSSPISLIYWGRITSFNPLHFTNTIVSIFSRCLQSPPNNFNAAGECSISNGLEISFRNYQFGCTAAAFKHRRTN